MLLRQLPPTSLAVVDTSLVAWVIARDKTSLKLRATKELKRLRDCSGPLGIEQFEDCHGDRCFLRQVVGGVLDAYGHRMYEPYRETGPDDLIKATNVSTWLVLDSNGSNFHSCIRCIRLC